MVKKAGKAHKEAEYNLKVKSSGSDGGESSRRKEKDDNNRSSSRKPKRKGKDKGKANSTDTITQPKVDNNNRVLRRYPRRFNDYKEACKGVPLEVIKERREKGLCTRCGKGPHNALHCAGEVDKGSLPSASVKAETATASISTAKKGMKPTASTSTAAIACKNASFHGYVDEEVIDYDSPMSC